MMVTPSSAFIATTHWHTYSNSPLGQSVSAMELTAVTTKPTGTSFLPAETIERCKVGNPIEKTKMEKDGTAAFVDVYEYARKIREGK